MEGDAVDGEGAISASLILMPAGWVLVSSSAHLLGRCQPGTIGSSSHETAFEPSCKSLDLDRSAVREA